MKMLRFRFGRALIHAGLAALPPSRSRNELTSILRDWGNHVRAVVAEDRLRQRMADAARGE